MRALVTVCMLALPALSQVGTATLTGKLQDLTGAGIADAWVELQSEQKAGASASTNADDSGTYRFSGLVAGVYTLKSTPGGFKYLTVKGIEIANGESKTLRTLELTLANFADCGGHASLDYLRVLPTDTATGSIRGAVLLKKGSAANTPPIAKATVTLICNKGMQCGTTKSDSRGEFEFRDLRPGRFVIRVSRPGFYPLDMPEFTVREGLESTYDPVYIERCLNGNCDPALRPPEPLHTCE